MRVSWAAAAPKRAGSSPSSTDPGRSLSPASSWRRRRSRERERRQSRAVVLRGMKSCVGVLSRLTETPAPTDAHGPEPDQETSVGYPEPLLWAHSHARGILRALAAAARGRPDPTRLDDGLSYPGQLRRFP